MSLSWANAWVWSQSVPWLEWAKVLTDLIKGVAWPLAAFMIVWLFRRQLRERIKDIIRAGPTGVVLQAGRHLQNAADLKPIEHPMRTVADLAEGISKELDQFQDDVRIPLLIRNLAEARIERAFDSIFNAIFGSQMTALRLLQERGHISVDEARDFFHTSVKPLNDKLYEEWDFERWSHYLIVHKFVQIGDDKVSLTQTGQDFLTFVATKPDATRPN